MLIKIKKLWACLRIFNSSIDFFFCFFYILLFFFPLLFPSFLLLSIDFGVYYPYFSPVIFSFLTTRQPKLASILEALGFTATSNNAAPQKEKLKAIENARTATKGVLNGPGAKFHGKWLDKYGYPRLFGSGGIFYTDQLSTDVEPIGGFNMGKSEKIWPIPEVVESGAYGGKGLGNEEERTRCWSP